MRRWPVKSLQACGAMLWACNARRSIHEKPFEDLPEDLSKGEAYEVARDALLQLNIMTRRGIEPDALMYTSLIQTMAKAGLEWQAYKLFSRMVELRVRPLPETYVALLNATSKSRKSLRADIQAKIQEAVETLPAQLAEAETLRQLQEDRKCVAKFEDYIRGELPSLHSDAAVGPTANTQPSSALSSSTAKKPSEDVSSVAPPTMHIRNPTDAWNTAQMAEKMREARGISGDAAKDIAQSLERLHEEELRIFLSIQRQFRHGSKSELIARILKTTSEQAVRDMLSRRSHYFRSVEKLLAADLRQLRMSGGGATSEERPVTDRTITKEEKELSSPDVLVAPWGLLRKPRVLPRHPDKQQQSPNAARLEQVRLSVPELVLVRHKAEVGDLDEVPESLLRRYAHQFRLRWRRKLPSSLLDAVQWHALTFLPKDVVQKGQEEGLLSPDPTPALRLQREREGMQKTLENFEAFRIIAQRTNNLQVVDHREINLSIKRARQDEARRERRQDEEIRRERNIMAAHTLAHSATQLQLPPDVESDTTKGTHVLGFDEAARQGVPRLSDASPASVPGVDDGSGVEDNDDMPAELAVVQEGSSSSELPQELPPWELFAGEDEFNLSTGRFGDPEMGKYRELNDSHFQVLPDRGAQTQWSVDRQLLPSRLQDVVQEAEMEQRRRHESIEKEYQEKLQYKKYKRWDQLISKAHEKAQRRREEEDKAEIKPLPPKRRMAQLLRKNNQKAKVSKMLREKYNKPL